MSLTLTLSPMRQSLSQMLSKARVGNNDAEVSKKHETTGTAATEAAKPVASALSLLVGPIPASILSILMQPTEGIKRASSIKAVPQTDQGAHVVVCRMHLMSAFRRRSRHHPSWRARRTCTRLSRCKPSKNRLSHRQSAQPCSAISTNVWCLMFFHPGLIRATVQSLLESRRNM
jgi:hypothetical protein